MVVGMRHHFIGFFGGAVKISRLVGLILDAKGDFFVQPIDGRGRRVDELRGRIGTACFKDRGEALEIRGDIVVRIGERIADASLRRQMYDMGDLMLRDKLFEKKSVADVSLEDLDALLRKDELAPFFKLHVVIRIKIIEANNKIAASLKIAG